jgi:hypothetical protein
MMKTFLDGYEQGYSAGLRLATTLPGERHGKREPEVNLEDRGNITSRPAYQHGFVDGLRDGVEVLVSVSNARGGREWRAPSSPYANEDYEAGSIAEGSPEGNSAHPVDTLRDELQEYHRLLRYGSNHIELRAPVERLRALIRHLGMKWCGNQ